MNIAYVTWLEDITAPVLSGQVIRVLKAIRREDPKIPITLVSFIGLHNRIRRAAKLRALKNSLDSDGIRCIFRSVAYLPRLQNRIQMTSKAVGRMRRVSTRKLHRICRKESFTVLHARSYPAMIPIVRLKPRYGYKVVFDPRSDFPEENISAGFWKREDADYTNWKQLEKEFLNSSDRTIMINETYARHYGELADRLRFSTIPNTVDTKLFVREPSARERIRRRYGIDGITFVYCGSLGNDWHRVEFYASAVEVLREVDPLFHFMFITTQAQNVTSYFHRHGISMDNVHVFSVPIEEVPDYLSAADVGLLFLGAPKIALAIKTVEYLAMSLFVVVNRNAQGAAEYLTRKGIGSVIGDPHDLAAIPYDELTSQDWQTRYRQAAAEDFSTVQVARAYIDVYRSIS